MTRPGNAAMTAPATSGGRAGTTAVPGRPATTDESSRPPLPVTVGNYRLSKQLGRGNFARVVEAVHNILQIKVAIKIIDTSRISQDYVIKNLSREAKLLSKLQHPGIIRLYETMQCGPTYYLVTELATGGDLCCHVRNQPTGRLDEATAKSYARQLASALQHMHSRDIVHRDLKMENIMLQDDKKLYIKIVDFGLGNVYDDINPLKTQCGSPEYAAPELFVKGKKYGPEVDLWSLGVILYVMGTGRLPFISPRDGQTSLTERRRRLMAQISQGLGATQERSMGELSSDYRDVVHRLLTPAASRRITMRDLCRHPFIVASPQALATSLDHELQAHLHDCDHDTIVEGIVTFTKLDRKDVEMDVINRRYGSIGGMYNIMAHELQRNGTSCIFKALRLRSSVKTANGMQSNLNHSRIKHTKHPAKSVKDSPSQPPSDKAKLNDSFIVAEYDRKTKKPRIPVCQRDKASSLKAKNYTEDRLQAHLKKANITNLKKNDERPTTISCSRRASTHIPSYKHTTVRPLSDLNKIEALHKEKLVTRTGQSNWLKQPTTRGLLYPVRNELRPVMPNLGLLESRAKSKSSGATREATQPVRSAATRLKSSTDKESEAARCLRKLKSPIRTSDKVRLTAGKY